MAESTYVLFKGIRDRLAGVLSTLRPAGASQNADIAAAGSLSAAVDLGDQRLQRIDMPAAWTAAALTFQASPDGVTYRNLHNAAGEISVPADVDRSIAVDPEIFASIRYIKVRSGTAAAPINQLAARTLVLVTASRA